MLEAGRDYDPVTETPMFQLPKDAPLRGAGTPEKPFGFYDATVDGGWSVPGEPYSSADGAEFMWWRARMLGGRTNHWGRISLRMGPYDFKPRSRDGLGFDWPLSRIVLLGFATSFSSTALVVTMLRQWKEMETEAGGSYKIKF